MSRFSIAITSLLISIFIFIPHTNVTNPRALLRFKVVIWLWHNKFSTAVFFSFKFLFTSPPSLLLFLSSQQTNHKSYERRKFLFNDFSLSWRYQLWIIKSSFNIMFTQIFLLLLFCRFVRRTQQYIRCCFIPKGKKIDKCFFFIILCFLHN